MAQIWRKFWPLVNAELASPVLAVGSSAWTRDARLGATQRRHLNVLGQGAPSILRQLRADLVELQRPPQARHTSGHAPADLDQGLMLSDIGIELSLFPVSRILQLSA